MRLFYVFSLLTFLFVFKVSAKEGNLALPNEVASYTDSSQSKGNEVKGVVVDSSGEALAGATISLKDQKTVVITDANGRFSFIAKSEVTQITVSCIGFQSKELKVRAGDDLKIVLVDHVNDIDEVVVTGFNSKSKLSYTGSHTTISKKELLSVGTKNIFENLKVFVPGLQIVEDNLSGSDPNKKQELNIRGRSSFEGAANLPLFVVDGVIVDVNYIYDMDMNDIESVTVLKDASASALYGAKASAGVIVITTKVLEGGRLKLNYSGTLRTSMPDLSDYRLLNSAEKLEFERLAGVYKGNTSEDQYMKDELYNTLFKRVRSGVYTDWLAKPLRGAVSHTHSISIDGGDEYSRYNMGLRYGKDEGVMIGSDRNRLSTFFKFSYNKPGKYTVSNTSTISFVNSNHSPYGDFASYVSQNPYDSPYGVDGKLLEKLTHNKINPLFEAFSGGYNKAESLDIMNTTALQLWFGKKFRLDADFSLQRMKSESNEFKSPTSASEIRRNRNNVNERGYLSESHTKAFSYSGKLLTSYNDYFFDVVFLSTTAGFNFDSYSGNSSGYRSVGYYTNKLANPGFAAGYPTSHKPTGSDDVHRSVGFFVNANAIYNNRYFVDVIYRYEGSSKFGRNHKFAPFWSIGGGWNINNESFLKDKDIQTLKLRGSVGYLGNVSFEPYQAYTTYEYSGDLYYYKGIGAVPKTIGNPDLKWERTLSTNVGLDLTMLGGRLDFSADYYIRNTDNLLLDVTKAPSIGVSTIRENIGSILNRGFEFRTRVVPIQTKEWYWGLSFILSHNKNRINSISNALKKRNEETLSKDVLLPLPIYEEGESLTALKVVPSAGIDPATGEEIYIKSDGSYSFEYDPRDKKVFGDTEPYVHGALSSYLTYKNFSLNMSFGYSFGSTIYNQTLVTRLEGVSPENNADARVFYNRWKNVGDITKYKRIDDRSMPKQTSRFVETNNYFTLSSLSLAYDLETKFLRKIKIRRMRLELLTNDLFYISSVKRERGLSYPFERSVEMSVKFTL